VGRGREVILEGEKRPGEERPFVDVNNVVVGERIRSMSDAAAARWQCDAGQLKSSEPRHRKVGNGREDGTTREGLAAANGEKPLKGGCPWTIRHETRLADPRHARSRER